MQPPDPPPIYQSPLPLQKSRPVWPLLLVGCLGAGFFGFVILAAILFPVFAAAREKARQTICMSNERQMSIGLLQYAQDFDEKMPASAAWMDKIQPYVTDEKAFHCPTARVKDRQSYGYAFRSPLSGKSRAGLGNLPTVVTLYDSTNLGRNASDAGTSLPSPGRHRSGNDIAYADGHVKYVRAAAGP